MWVCKPRKVRRAQSLMPIVCSSLKPLMKTVKNFGLFSHEVRTSVGSELPVQKDLMQVVSEPINKRQAAFLRNHRLNSTGWERFYLLYWSECDSPKWKVLIHLSMSSSKEKINRNKCRKNIQLFMFPESLIFVDRCGFQILSTRWVLTGSDIELGWRREMIQMLWQNDGLQNATRSS